MSDPTYHYVKGSGWVASTHQHNFIRRINDAGTRILTLIDRKPEDHEARIYGLPDWYDSNGVADLEKHWNHAKDHNYTHTNSMRLDAPCITVLSEPVSGLSGPNG